MTATNGGEGDEPLRPVELPAGVRDDDFACFFRTADRPLMKMLMTRGASLEEAEDAVQVAMQEVFSRWPELTSPFGYAWHAALHAFQRVRLRDVRRRELETSARVPGPGDDPHLTVWEDRQFVARLLDRLSPAQRTVLALTFDGYRSTEIAELLGKNPAAIRKTLQLARDRLRTQVGQELGHAPRQRGRVQQVTEQGSTP